MREKRGSTPLRLLHADTRTARRETAPVTSSPLILALVLQSCMVQRPRSLTSLFLLDLLAALLGVHAPAAPSSRQLRRGAPRAPPPPWEHPRCTAFDEVAVSSTRCSLQALRCCTASRQSGWGCHQSVPLRPQCHLRTRPPGPLMLRCATTVRMDLHQTVPSHARRHHHAILQGHAASRCAATSAASHRCRCVPAPAERARATPRLRCGALSAPPLSDSSLFPCFGGCCGSRRISAPSFSPSLRCVLSRAAHRGPSRVVARDTAELVVASRTTIQPSLGPRRVQVHRRAHKLQA
jgi:hypothetical protein